MYQNKYIVSGLHGNIGGILKELDNTLVDYNEKKEVNAEVFLHLASKSYGDYTELINSNIGYLGDIIKYCKNNKIKKLVFFSAMSVYGEINKEFIDEETVYNNPNMYGLTKLLGESILKESGLKVLVLRLPMVLTADRNNGVLNRFINTLSSNEVLTLTNYNNMFNNFVSVKTIYRFIDNYPFSKDYEIVNLGAKNSFTLYEIVKYLKEKLNSKSRIVLEDSTTNSFFNISLKKAMSYGLELEDVESELDNWLTIRNRN